MDRHGRVHNDAQMVGAMIPILSSSYPYTGNGLGGLSDCIEYTVTHEVNGEYEFSMRYPITGEHFDELAINYFVTAIPDNLTPAQPFRIYRITKPLNGVVTVYARHISYDMSGIVVEPFTADSLTTAIQTIPTKCTPASPVTIQTDRTVATGMTLSEPRTLWKLLGGQAGSFLDVYGGEWDFNGLTATLKTRLGSDRGVEIRYGKNMTALEQDATIESTYAGVYPYWYDEESGTLVNLPEKYVNISGALVSGRVLLLDLSGDFDDAPTEAQLRARAEQYIAANSVGSAKTSWKVSFQSLEDENRALESVMLGDTLKVKYSALGVDATSRVVKVEFDGLKERYKTVTIGRVKQNLAAIIVGNNQETQEKIDASAKSAYERAVDAATESIRNGAGAFRLIYNGDILQEIVSLDDPDITLAQKVWRWNNGGFGFSSTGYNGTYNLAITQNGEIVADFITAGTLNANVIRAGILQDAAGKNSWNLDTHELLITDGSMTATYTDPKIFYRADYDSDPDVSTNTDIQTIRSIVQRGAPFSEEELERYDFNSSGTITMADLIKLRNMILADADQVISRTAVIDPREEKIIRVWDTELRDIPRYLTEQTSKAYKASATDYSTGAEVTEASTLEPHGFYSHVGGRTRAHLGADGLTFYDSNVNATLTCPAAPTSATVSSSYVSTLQFTRVGNIVTMVLLDPKSLVANGLRNLGVVIPDGYRPYAVSDTNLPFDMPGLIRVFVYPSGQIQIYNFTTNTGTMNVSMTVTWSAI